MLRRSDNAKQCGFSLVEMLVTLALAALAATLIVGGAMPSGGSLGEETDRLAAHLVGARDRAIMTNRPVRITLDAEGYRETVRNRNGWSPGDDASPTTHWKAGTSFAADGENADVHIVFDPVGLTEPVTIRLFRDRTTEALVVSGAGDIRRGGGNAS